MDPSLVHSIKNWGAKQNPPAYVRARLLRRAGNHVEGTRIQQLGKNLLMKIRALTPYWTGQPLSHAELAKWLFSQAMLDCLRMDRDTLRVVC
jgi:hypothetical protein